METINGCLDEYSNIFHNKISLRVLQSTLNSYRLCSHYHSHGNVSKLCNSIGYSQSKKQLHSNQRKWKQLTTCHDTFKHFSQTTETTKYIYLKKTTKINLNTLKNILNILNKILRPSILNATMILSGISGQKDHFTLNNNYIQINPLLPDMGFSGTQDVAFSVKNGDFSTT